MIALAHAAADTELLQASKSPNGLARYIESHRNFDWRPLWRALELSDTPILPCEAQLQCATEQIKLTVPPQTVVAIHLPAGAVVYIRYIGDERKGWRRAGAIAATIKNHPPRHSVIRVGTKPFLQFSEQGVSGSDISSELEWWIDLTRPEFEPVFGFTPQGRQNRMGFGVSRIIRATATPKVQGTTETIEVNLELEYAGLETLGKTNYIAPLPTPYIPFPASQQNTATTSPQPAETPVAARSWPPTASRRSATPNPEWYNSPLPAHHPADAKPKPAADCRT